MRQILGASRARLSFVALGIKQRLTRLPCGSLQVSSEANVAMAADAPVHEVLGDEVALDIPVAEEVAAAEGPAAADGGELAAEIGDAADAWLLDVEVPVVPGGEAPAAEVDGGGGAPAAAGAAGAGLGGGGGAAGPELAAAIALAAVENPFVARRRELEDQRRALVAERQRLYDAMRNEQRRRDRIMERARGLTTDDIIAMLGANLNAQAKAKAKAKGKGKAKAKAKAKAAGA